MLKNKHILLLLLTLATQKALALSDVESGIVDNKKITPAEANSLDAVCRLILIDKPGIHGPVSQRLNRELFSRPEFEMAKDSGFLHHRCWAMIHKHRYLSARNVDQRKMYLSRFYNEMDYVLKNAPIDWKFRPHVIVEVGTTRLLEGANSKAVIAAREAIQLDKQFSDAYSLLADAYLNSNNTTLATIAIQNGLEINPTSKSLRKRAMRLGIKTPDTEPSSNPSPSGVDLTKNEVLNKQVKPTTSREGSTKEPNIDPLANQNTDHGKNKDTQILEGTSNSSEKRHNPYCRFCP